MFRCLIWHWLLQNQSSHLVLQSGPRWGRGWEVKEEGEGDWGRDERWMEWGRGGVCERTGGIWEVKGREIYEVKGQGEEKVWGKCKGEARQVKEIEGQGMQELIKWRLHMKETGERVECSYPAGVKMDSIRFWAQLYGVLCTFQCHLIGGEVIWIGTLTSIADDVVTQW